MAETLNDWLGSLIPARYKTPSAFAQALGWSLTTFNRGRESGTFSIENLLHLAHTTGASASRVLTLAGKRDLADAIERAYGPARPPTSPAVRALAQRLEAMRDGDEIAQALDDLIGQLAAAIPEHKPKPVGATPPAPAREAGDTRHTRADRSRGARRAAGKG